MSLNINLKGWNFLLRAKTVELIHFQSKIYELNFLFQHFNNVAHPPKFGIDIWKCWWILYLTKYCKLSQTIFHFCKTIIIDVTKHLVCFSSKNNKIFFPSLNLDSKHPLTLCSEFSLVSRILTFLESQNSIKSRVWSLKYVGFGWNCLTLNTNYNVFGTESVYGRKTSKIKKYVLCECASTKPR